MDHFDGLKLRVNMVLKPASIIKVVFIRSVPCIEAEASLPRQRAFSSKMASASMQGIESDEQKLWTMVIVLCALHLASESVISMKSYDRLKWVVEGPKRRDAQLKIIFYQVVSLLCKLLLDSSSMF